MTKARDIIAGSLTFHLNRLSPGETLDADLGARCLDALNHIADEMNGVKSFIFREILTTSTPISGTLAMLGVDWPTLSPGDKIRGATVQYTAGLDIPLGPLTMGQYADISMKAVSSIPNYFAHDGAAAVFFWPACAGQTVTLRTLQSVSDFADLDTDYSMPKGYKSALSAWLAEVMAPTMIGAVTPAIATAASTARARLAAQASNPAIIGAVLPQGNILTGWR